MRIPAINKRWALLYLSAAVLASCRTQLPQVSPTELQPNAAETAAASASPSPTATITPTPEPMAAQVNGQPVSLAWYESELERFQAAAAQLGATPQPEEARQQVLNALVQEQLLAQAADENGYHASETELEERFAGLVTGAGGEQAFDAWLAAQFFTRDSFRAALARSMAASWQRDQILASVPETVEQVRARQILALSASQAEGLYRQLEAGWDFENLAVQYDPLTGGELGWFPRGYLTQPEVEEAAFALQDGEYSGVIETDFGYHIIQVLEHKEEPLSPDARQTLQRKALEDWLAERQAASDIQILLP